VDVKVDIKVVENNVREQLANKISSTHTGLWLLLPAYQKLGVWDILQNVFKEDNNIAPRLGMQLVNEAALGVNRIRSKGSLPNQGFSIANGLPFLASDESVHHLLNNHTMEDFRQVQIQLLQMRKLSGHYSENCIYALDPHRIQSATKRIAPEKKKKPDQPSTKMLQTFFSVDAITGQPLVFSNGSSGKTCTSATLELMQMLKEGGVTKGLFIADKEHFTQAIGDWFSNEEGYDILMPAPLIDKIKNIYPTLKYRRNWAGYATAETTFSFNDSNQKLKLLVQRQGEVEEKYAYNGFITTSQKNTIELLTENYPSRWTIEEFFNFENAHGWNNASTHNLNIKFGKQTLALMGQAAVYELRQNLPEEFAKLNAENIANKILTNTEGDIKVVDDYIVITYYGNHEKLLLKEKYENIETKLINQNINPKIPWLFDYKLKFNFK
jgi:hypothetical protein